MRSRYISRWDLNTLKTWKQEKDFKSYPVVYPCKTTLHPFGTFGCFGISWKFIRGANDQPEAFHHVAHATCWRKVLLTRFRWWARVHVCDWFQGMEWPEPGNVEELKNYLYDWCTNPLMISMKLISRSDFFGQGEEAQMTPPSAVPSQSDSRTHATVTQIFPSQAKRSRLCKYMKCVLDKNE